MNSPKAGRFITGIFVGLCLTSNNNFGEVHYNANQLGEKTLQLSMASLFSASPSNRGIVFTG